MIQGFLSRRAARPALLFLVHQLALAFFFLSMLIAPANAFFMNERPTVVQASRPLLLDLESLIKVSNFGVNESNQQEVKDLMVTISKSRVGDQRTNLSGKWELIYSTEKEINFFRTSWPFAKVSSITQKLDLYNSKTVENFIDFEGGGQFAVTGSVKAVDGDDGYDRAAFEFTTATALLWGRPFSVPPVGAGWFDTMFCNEEYRLSRDSRGDWSVFRRLS